MTKEAAALISQIAERAVYLKTIPGDAGMIFMRALLEEYGVKTVNAIPEDRLQNFLNDLNTVPNG